MPVAEVLSTPVRRAAPAVTAVIRAGSHLRGERLIHARGRTVSGRLTVTGGSSYGAPLLDTAAEHDLVVRISRSVGLPSVLPDVLGLAIRVLGAHGPGRHQDLLLDSTLPAPLLRRWPVPGRSPTHFGSLLSYDVAGVRRMIGARGSIDSGSLELLVATVHGPWESVGRLVLGDEVPRGRQIRFNVWNTGGGITPAGALQEWRRRAYDESHVGPDA